MKVDRHVGHDCPLKTPQYPLLNITKIHIHTRAHRSKPSQNLRHGEKPQAGEKGTKRKHIYREHCFSVIETLCLNMLFSMITCVIFEIISQRL